MQKCYFFKQTKNLIMVTHSEPFGLEDFQYFHDHGLMFGASGGAHGYTTEYGFLTMLIKMDGCDMSFIEGMPE